MRGPIGLLTALALLTGPAAAGDPATDEIAEAVFRQQIGFWQGHELSDQTVLCVGIHENGATRGVNPASLVRLQRLAAVRPASACDARAEGAVERTTKRPAVLLTAGAIEPVAADEVRVRVHYFRTQMKSGHETYRVVRERSGWVCLGPIVQGAPF